MEEMTGKGTSSIGSNTPSHRQTEVKAIPNYLRPSTGSCHHACKYGGKHTFEEKEASKAQPKPRKQSPVTDNQKRMMIKARSLSRRRVRDASRPQKADKVVEREDEVEPVEWKDIVAYDTAAGGETCQQPNKIPANAKNSGESKKKEVVRGKRSHEKAKVEQDEAVKKQNGSLNKKLIKSVRLKLIGKASTEPRTAKKVASPSPPPNNTNVAISNPSTKRWPSNASRPKKATAFPVKTKVTDEKKVQEQAPTHVKEEKTLHSPEQEEFETFESIRSAPVYRKAKSMSMGSRSVRFPFMQQASKNVATFKLRSRSSKAPDMPSESEKPARLWSRRGSRAAGEESSRSIGIQLRIRSLQRRGLGVSGGTNTGFVVPAVALRHQKTLEKKRSQRLYNNLIEETASKLVKARKSRVKALVGAFETLITKIKK